MNQMFKKSIIGTSVLFMSIAMLVSTTPADAASKNIPKVKNVTEDARKVNKKRVTLNWDKEDTAKSYQIRITNKFNKTHRTVLVKKNRKKKLVKKLTPGIDYEFKVRVKNTKKKKGKWSNPVKLTTKVPKTVRAIEHEEEAVYDADNCLEAVSEEDNGYCWIEDVANMNGDTNISESGTIILEGNDTIGSDWAQDFVTQNIEGKYLLSISRAKAENVEEDDITGKPYMYGYMMEDGSILEYLQDGEEPDDSRLTGEADWTTIYSIHQFDSSTNNVRYFANQASSAGNSSEDRYAYFKDCGAYIFDSVAEAEAFVTEYTGESETEEAAVTEEDDEVISNSEAISEDNCLVAEDSSENEYCWKDGDVLTYGDATITPDRTTQLAGTEDDSAYALQDINLGDTEGMYVVFITEAKAENVISGDITGQPYMYGYMFDEDDMIVKYLQNGNTLEGEMRYDEEDWGIAYGIYELEEGTESLRYFDKQAKKAGTDIDGRVAEFRNQAVYIASDLTHAQSLVSDYTTAAAE